MKVKKKRCIKIRYLFNEVRLRLNSYLYHLITGPKLYLTSAPRPAMRGSGTGRSRTRGLTGHESYTLPTEPTWQTICTNGFQKIPQCFSYNNKWLLHTYFIIRHIYSVEISCTYLPFILCYYKNVSSKVFCFNIEKCKVLLTFLLQHLY